MSTKNGTVRITPSTIEMLNLKLMEETIAKLAEARQLAARFFNEVWKYLEKPDRTHDDDLHMIHLAHASRLHWQYAGDANNHAIGEWQISRVYSILRRSEPALYHARECLRIASENHLRPFLLGFAHEAMARSLAIEDREAAKPHLEMGRVLVQTVDDPEERQILESDLLTIS